MHTYIHILAYTCIVGRGQLVALVKMDIHTYIHILASGKRAASGLVKMNIHTYIYVLAYTCTVGRGQLVALSK